MDIALVNLHLLVVSHVQVIRNVKDKKVRNYKLIPMGQKTHPIGLRLGIHRKWATSWFLSTPVKDIKTNSVLQDVVTFKGGNLRSHRESRLSTLLGRFAFSTRASSTGLSAMKGKRNTRTPQKGSKRLWSKTKRVNQSYERLLPVDLHIRVGSGGSLTLFLFYRKFFGREA